MVHKEDSLTIWSVCCVVSPRPLSMPVCVDPVMSQGASFSHAQPGAGTRLKITAAWGGAGPSPDWHVVQQHPCTRRGAQPSTECHLNTNTNKQTYGCDNRENTERLWVFKDMTTLRATVCSNSGRIKVLTLCLKGEDTVTSDTTQPVGDTCPGTVHRAAPNSPSCSRCTERESLWPADIQCLFRQTSRQTDRHPSLMI